jgi:hypothetical protein
VTRRCLRFGTTPEPFGPVQSPLAAVLQHQALTFVGYPCVTARAFRSLGLGWSFPGLVVPFPSSRFSASRPPDCLGVSLATLLSIAVAVVTRRRPQVCTLPLNRSGRISAPWPPTTCARFPSRFSRVRFAFGGLCHVLQKTLSPRGSRARMSLTVSCFAGQSAADSGLSATPTDYSAVELPDRLTLQHRDPDFQQSCSGCCTRVHHSLNYRILVGFA